MRTTRKPSKSARSIRSDFTAAFKQCDAIICPTSPTAAFKIGEKADDPLAMYLSDIFTISANLAAIPGLSIPCGRTAAGLPIGLQLMGDNFDDTRLLSIAAAFEGATAFHLEMPKL